MSDPFDLASFRARYAESLEAERCDCLRGFMLPCPFCAAPDFSVYAVFDVGVPLVQRCHECRRSAYFLLEAMSESGVRGFSVVQTGGPKQPSWFNSRFGWVT